MASPETEASVIFMRSLRRLFEETTDLMRIRVHECDGTFQGATLNQVIKDFLHHRVTASIVTVRSNFKLDELPEGNLWVIINNLLTNYLDVLPDTMEQAVTILYETLDRDRINQLIMNSVPSSVEMDLRMLSGGRWLQEVLELKLVRKCEASI